MGLFQRMFQLKKMEKKTINDYNPKMGFSKQVTVNSLGTAVVLLSQWLISVLLVRMGGFADAGVFSLVMSVANAFGAVSSFGLRSYQISDAGNEFSQKQYLYARVTTIALSFAACAIYLICDDAYSPMSKWAIILYACYTNCNYLGDIMLGTMQLRGRLELAGYSCAIRGASCFAAFIATYLICHNLLLSIAAMAVANLLVTVFYDVRNYRAVCTEPRGYDKTALRVVKRLLLVCFPLMMSGLLPLVTVAIPRRSIAGSMGEEYLGYYASVFTPTVLITTLLPSAVLGFVPKIAGAWQEKDKKGFQKKVGICVSGVFGFTLLALIAALVLGRPVMRFVFGEEIMPYFGLLYVAIIVSGLNALGGLGDAVLVCMRKTKSVTFLVAMELVIVGALADRFISDFGIYGAAYVMLAGYSAHVLVQTAFIIIQSGRYFAHECDRGK